MSKKPSRGGRGCQARSLRSASRPPRGLHVTPSAASWKFNVLSESSGNKDRHHWNGAATTPVRRLPSASQKTFLVKRRTNAHRLFTLADDTAQRQAANRKKKKSSSARMVMSCTGAEQRVRLRLERREAPVDTHAWAAAAPNSHVVANKGRNMMQIWQIGAIFAFRHNQLFTPV